MKKLFTFILLVALSGCATMTQYEKKKEKLEQDIEILKLEVRKEKLQNKLEHLETE